MVLFEDALERVRRRYLFVVGGYVVMAGGPCLVRRFIKLRVPPVPRLWGPGMSIWTCDSAGRPRSRFWDLGNYNPFPVPCAKLRPAGAQWI